MNTKLAGTDVDLQIEFYFIPKAAIKAANYVCSEGANASWFGKKNTTTRKTGVQTLGFIDATTITYPFA